MKSVAQFIAPSVQLRIMQPKVPSCSRTLLARTLQARADEVMEDIAVLPKQRLYSILTTNCINTPDQQPQPSSTGTPYYDPTIGSDPGQDVFLTAMDYSFYVTNGARDVQPGNAFDVTAGPVPTSGPFNVEFTHSGAPEDVLIGVYNAIAQRVTFRPLRAAAGANRLSMDLTPYPAGIYTIKVTSKTLQSSVRISKL